MAAVKTETITVRIEPAVKAGLKSAAEQERRFDAFTRKDLVAFNRAAAASGVSQLFVPGQQ